MWLVWPKSESETTAGPSLWIEEDNTLIIIWEAICQSAGRAQRGKIKDGESLKGASVCNYEVGIIAPQEHGKIHDWIRPQKQWNKKA